MLFVWCVFWVVLCWHVELVYIFELWFAQCGSKQLTKKWIGMSFYPLVWGGVKANLKSSYPSSRFQRQQLNHSIHCPRRMKRKHPHEHGSSIAQTTCFHSEVGWSALVDCSLEAKPNKHLGRVHGRHSVPIPTFSHWFIQEEMSTYASELLQVPWRSSCLTLYPLEQECSVGDPDITLAGPHLIRGFSWAQEQRSLNCSFLWFILSKWG